MNESLTFMSMYLHDVETKFNHKERNFDVCHNQPDGLPIFVQKTRPFGPITSGEGISRKDLEIAHRFIINNCDEVEPFIM